MAEDGAAFGLHSSGRALKGQLGRIFNDSDVQVDFLVSANCDRRAAHRLTSALAMQDGSRRPLKRHHNQRKGDQLPEVSHRLSSTRCSSSSRQAV